MTTRVWCCLVGAWACRLARYRLRDNYTRFCLKYVEPHKREIDAGTYRYASLETLPGWNSILGLQFENLVVNNAMDLIPFLHVGQAIVESAAPYRNSRKGRDGKSEGCQVDLLVQTARSAYVVEIKRRRMEERVIVCPLSALKP